MIIFIAHYWKDPGAHARTLLVSQAGHSFDFTLLSFLLWRKRQGLSHRCHVACLFIHFHHIIFKDSDTSWLLWLPPLHADMQPSFSFFQLLLQYHLLATWPCRYNLADWTTLTIHFSAKKKNLSWWLYGSLSNLQDILVVCTYGMKAFSISCLYPP